MNMCVGVQPRYLLCIEGKECFHEAILVSCNSHPCFDDFYILHSARGVGVLKVTLFVPTFCM